MTPRLWILVLITFLGCYMLLDSFFHHQRDVPGCQMSYSRPSFIPIPVPHSRFTNKYSLYLYREGGIDPDNQLLGVPTLFIPGHAGSYKQARSIAAESAYYYQSLSAKEFRYGLDVFTVDLNEEFSAIAGDLVYDQAEYLNDAIKQILTYYQDIAEYQGRPIPASVIVVGHSMGGIVARIMQHLPSYIPGSINTIFTLATPHSMAPIVLDSSTDMIYRRHLSQPLNDTMVISVAGGTQDITVNTDAAILPPSMSTGLTVFATAVPGVWTGCDHMAIMWCNQLVKKVAAALVDSTDIRSTSQTAPLDERRRIFEKHLIQTTPVVLDPGAPLILSANAIHINHNEQQRLVDQQQIVYDLKQNHGRLGILSNLQDVDSLHVNFCKNEATGLQCSRLTSGFQKIPSFGNGKTHPFESGTVWLLEMDDTLWHDFDLVVVESTRQTPHGFLRIGMYKNTHVLSLFDMAMGAVLNVDARFLATDYHLPSIISPLVAFKLVMHNTSKPAPLVRQVFAGESKFHILKKNADIHFHRGPYSEKDGLLLTVWPNNDDDLILHLQLDWYGSLGKCVLRLGPAIPMCLFIVSLSYLAHQLSASAASGASPLTEWMVCETYSLVGLYGVVVVAGQVWPDAFGLMDGSFLWWPPLFLLSAGLFLILAVIVSFFIGVFQWLPPIPTSLWVLLFSCLGFLPVSVVAVLVYFNWLFLCASSYRSAKASNASRDWVRYRGLFAIAMVLTAGLPYHIPGTVVYIRDLMVGWKFSVSLATLLNDAPTLVSLVLLFIIGPCDGMRKSNHWMARTTYVFILYYTLVGIHHPFGLHQFFNALLP